MNSSKVQDYLSKPIAEATDLEVYNAALQMVKGFVENKGYKVGNIDATIIAQRPKLRPFIDKMCQNIAKACNVDVDDVNIKATTEEGLGFTGSGEGISSQAICMLTSPFDLTAQQIAGGCEGCQGCHSMH